MSPSVGAAWPAPKIMLSIGLQYSRSAATGASLRAVQLSSGGWVCRVDLKPQKRTEALEDPTAEAPPSYLHFVYGERCTWNNGRGCILCAWKDGRSVDPEDARAGRQRNHNI